MVENLDQYKKLVEEESRRHEGTLKSIYAELTVLQSGCKHDVGFKETELLDGTSIRECLRCAKLID